MVKNKKIRGAIMLNSLGGGSSQDFWESEYYNLNLGDKRLNQRAKKVALSLSQRLTTCVRRLAEDAKEAHQTYDFF